MFVCVCVLTLARDLSSHKSRKESMVPILSDPVCLTIVCTKNQETPVIVKSQGLTLQFKKDVILHLARYLSPASIRKIILFLSYFPSLSISLLLSLSIAFFSVSCLFSSSSSSSLPSHPPFPIISASSSSPFLMPPPPSQFLSVPLL